VHNNLEMVNQGLHGLLHLGAWRRHDLVVIDLDSARRHLRMMVTSGALRRGIALAVPSWLTPSVAGYCTYLIDALVDDAQRLAHLLNTDQVAVIAVAVHTDRDVELDLVVRCAGKTSCAWSRAAESVLRLCHRGCVTVRTVVGLHLAQVPFDAGTAEHGPTVAVVDGVLRGYDANIDRALQPSIKARRDCTH